MKKVLGYLDHWSRAPGEPVAVMVSTYGPAEYDAAFVRIICGDDSPSGPGFKEEQIAMPFAGRHAGRQQPIRAGSFGLVPSAPALERLGGFSLQAMVWPTTPAKGRQGLIAKWNPADRSGFALFIDETGCLAVRLGDGNGQTAEVNTGRPLPERSWSLVAASFDPASRKIRLHQISEATWAPASDTVERQAELAGIGSNSVPLLIGAFGHGCDHFNGKIESPSLAGRDLSLAEIISLIERPSSARFAADVVAAWDFGLEIPGDRMIDVSANRLHGRFVNMPSRGVKGCAWSGREFCWPKSPAEYGAVHFHDDDLYDAGWRPDFRFTLPADLKSGVYAVRLEADGDWFYLPLFVRPPRGTKTQGLAFLASTATYLAYANYQWLLQEPLAELKNAAVLALDPGEVFLQEHPEFGLSTYDRHSDGSGSRYASRLRPVLNMNVKSAAWSFNADTHLLDWLEAAGQPFDVVTDEDLHDEGLALIDGYAAILTGTHPEYWSTAMWQGMKAYLSRGGRLFYIGGNGFYWRCAFHPERPGVVEVRRTEDGARYWAEEPGEYYLQSTGEYGGLWRRVGEPPQTLVGVGTVATGFDASSYYRRRPESFDSRAAFVFEGVGADEPIGNFGSLLGGAAGLELDAADRKLGTPPHALVLASSEEHSPGMMLAPEETDFHHQVMDGAQNPAVRADLVFFETGNGGAVFSTGSIAWAGSLAHNGYDNNVARITKNVIRRFLDPAPFELPARRATPRSAAPD